MDLWLCPILSYLADVSRAVLGRQGGKEGMESGIMVIPKATYQVRSVPWVSKVGNKVVFNSASVPTLLSSS